MEDPLQWVLHIRLHRNFDPVEKAPVREMLKAWSEKNGCPYRRSEFHKQDFRAVIIVPGWGPESDKVPY